MARSKRGQAAHDRKVLEEAKKLKSLGFDVRADIRGFSKPKTISGYRPDIVAHKGKQQRIIEVETQESKNTARDEGQKAAFRKVASKDDGTTFRRVMADE